MIDHKKAEEVAVQRFQIISPLLTEGLDAGKATPLKARNCQSNGISERTIRRSRSVARIIQILDWDGLAEIGQIKRSTLQEKLNEKGYSSRQMKLYS